MEKDCRGTEGGAGGYYYWMHEGAGHGYGSHDSLFRSPFLSYHAHVTRILLHDRLMRRRKGAPHVAKGYQSSSTYC